MHRFLETPSSSYQFVIPGVLAVLAIFEVAHNIIVGPWPGYNATAMAIIDLIIIPFWLVALATVVLRRSSNRGIVPLAIAIAFSHGVGVALGGSHWGAIFVFGGMIALACVFAQSLAARSTPRWESGERELATTPARPPEGPDRRVA